MFENRITVWCLRKQGASLVLKHKDPVPLANCITQLLILMHSLIWNIKGNEYMTKFGGTLNILDVCK